MAIIETKDEQMASSLEHGKDTNPMNYHPINLSIGHLEAMQNKTPIINQATNHTLPTDNPSPTPAIHSLNNQQSPQNAKNPIYPKKETQTHSNSKAT